MANVKKIRKSVATRIWAWLSRGVNHPIIAAPSEWLVERLSESLPSDHQISDEIWKIARRSLVLRFPGLTRPLGSCYHPRVADVLDVAYHYGAATQRVLRKVASAAAEIVHIGDGLWAVEGVEGDDHASCIIPGVCYTPPTARHKGAHIGECPRLLGQLAVAIREGRAPAIEDIRPSFFENKWGETRAEEILRDEEAKKKFSSIAGLIAELKVRLFETEVARLEVNERWYDQYHCPNGRHTSQWFTNGRKTEVNSEIWEEENGYFGGGGYKSLRIEGATFAFSREFAPGNGGGGRGAYSVHTVYLWPGYDQAAVAEALKDALKR